LRSRWILEVVAQREVRVGNLCFELICTEIYSNSSSVIFNAAHIRLSWVGLKPLRS
jgi:hypothetical protein